MMKSDFNFTEVELAIIGHFLESSFTTDKAAFISISPMYSMGFITTFKDLHNRVKEIVTPETHISETKKLTEQLNIALETLAGLSIILKSYCQKTYDNLRFPIKDIKLAGLQLCILNKKPDLVVKYSYKLQQKLNSCLDVLETAGYSAGHQAHLSGLISTIEQAHQKLQKIKLQHLFYLDENQEILNEFRAMLDDIMDTGKLLHRNNPARRNEYLSEVLINKVRRMHNIKEKVYLLMPAT